MKKLSLVLMLFGIVLFQNCKKETQDTPQQQEVTDDEAKAVVETDATGDDIMDMVDVYGFNATSGTANRSTAHHQLPACVTQTIVRTGGSVSITWEFDANGCTMLNGNTYRGTISINRSFDTVAQSISGSVAFTNFSVNGIGVDGGFDFVRVRSNANGNPQSTNNYDFTITFLNGDVTQRSGTRVREWIEGYTTPRMRNDDVFLVTGNSHIVRRNGVVLDLTITTPLRREVPCRYFVSGVIEIVKNGATSTLDFGNGTCDNEATLTLPNGNTRTIHLR
jgi:hypothetical protein